uniref:Zinc finger C2HC5-type domain-containing protein n=1 Tax=Setaria digitata TaxID=48799 RepID=A0A915PZI0_9BILA
MSRQSHSLKSLAESLSESHSHQQKPNIRVTLKNTNPADRLRQGRHRCDCQARIHRLIRNCLSCGRVVCEQEGSGPCMFCGELVCTREEREILSCKSRKSIALYNKLMGSDDDKAIDNRAFSLASVGNSLIKAEQYKNKLLAADADTELRSRVHDLESDYYNMENNIYLTKAERDAIMARKEELKELRARQQRALVVDFDFEKANVSEVRASYSVFLDTIARLSKENHQNTRDPVIESILLASRRREQALTSKPLLKWAPDGFVPKYSKNQLKKHIQPEGKNEGDIEDEAFMLLSDEVIYMEVARKGYSMCIAQPMATLLVYGFRRHFPWHEDLDIRGPILITSKSKAASKVDIEKEISHCRHFLRDYGMESCEFPSEFPPGVIVGRALLRDCLPREEYEDKFSNSECSGTEGSHVLIFDVFEPLLIPIPHIPTSDGIYQVDKQLRNVIRQILEPVSFA